MTFASARKLLEIPSVVAVLPASIAPSEEKTVNLISLVSMLDKSPLFKLDPKTFIETIQRAIPESGYLDQIANATVEGVAETKATKTLYGKPMLDEKIRAFVGLLGFQKVVNGEKEDYLAFTKSQKEQKLSPESFADMGRYIRDNLKTPEDYAAAIWFILCNDLGKVKKLEAEYKKIPGAIVAGHDVMLAELLKQKPELFPAFSLLPPDQHQKDIRLGSATACGPSTQMQLEFPIVSLEPLATLTQTSLAAYFLSNLFDIVGANAHVEFKIINDEACIEDSSSTMHEKTWICYNVFRQSLEKFHTHGATIEEANAHYLTDRGTLIGINNTNPENAALIRIACLARFATDGQGRMLLTAWSLLPPDVRTILVHELNIHGGKEERAIFIGYGVAMIANAKNALINRLGEAPRSDQINAAIVEGLRICLLHFARVFADARKHIGAVVNPRKIFVAFCGDLATKLKHDPSATLGMALTGISKSERRMDFSLAPRLTPVLFPREAPKADIAAAAAAPASKM